MESMCSHASDRISHICYIHNKPYPHLLPCTCRKSACVLYARVIYALSISLGVSAVCYRHASAHPGLTHALYKVKKKNCRCLSWTCLAFFISLLSGKILMSTGQASISYPPAVPQTPPAYSVGHHLHVISQTKAATSSALSASAVPLDTRAGASSTLVDSLFAQLPVCLPRLQNKSNHP